MKTFTTLLGALALGAAGPALAGPGGSQLASELFRDTALSQFSSGANFQGSHHGKGYGLGQGTGHEPGHGGGHCRGHHDDFCGPASP